MTREEAVSIIEDRVRVTEYVNSSYVDCVDIEALKMAIKALRQPEIIRCKDCKFYTSMIPTEGLGICSLAGRHLGDDGFCSEAERRNDADH